MKIKFPKNKIINLYYSLRLKAALAKAYYYDRRLGIETMDNSPIHNDKSKYKDMRGYQPSFYGRLEKIVRYLQLGREDVFVDLGCGRGRVVFFLATQRLKKVIGVELDEELISLARRNLANLKIKRTPVDLIQLDAVHFDPREGTVFFLFNPFGRKTIEQVIENIRRSLITNPRLIRIVYYAPCEREILDKQDWLVLESKISDNNCLAWRSTVP